MHLSVVDKAKQTETFDTHTRTNQMNLVIEDFCLITESLKLN